MSSENDRQELDQNAETIVKNHMIWSMGAGLIPIPIADFFAVGAIQLDMVRQLCKLYEVPFKETEGKAVISALTGAGLAKMGARAAIKFIPGIGSVVGGVSMAVLSGASTYAVGQSFKKHFETGGTILDFDLDRLKKVYDEKFEKGKEVARKVKKEQEAAKKSGDTTGFDSGGIKPDAAKGNEDVIAKLKELSQMKQDGIITEAEFLELKKKLIGS